MTKISELTSGGAMVSTDEILALRSGANVRVTIGNMVSQSSSAVSITGGTISGLTSLAVTGKITANGGIAFPDGDKATFGTGNDLEIYHDASNSYITDVGTGNLKIGGANVEITTAGGTKYFQGAANVAKLYHTGNERLSTTLTGVSISGDATISGDVLALDRAAKGGEHQTWFHQEMGHAAMIVAEGPSSGGIDGAHYGENMYIRAASGTLDHLTTAGASWVRFSDGVTYFVNAASGTADAAVSQVASMTISAAGAVDMASTLGVGGKITVTEANAGTYAGEFINQNTGHGVLVKAGSSASHNVLLLEAFDGTDMFKFDAGGSLTAIGGAVFGGNLSQSISTAGANNNLSLRNTNAGATALTNINLGTDLSTATATITTFSEAHANAGKLLIHTGANRDLVLGTNGTDRVTVDGSTGGVTLSSDLDVTGAVSKGSGSFKISHPLPELTDTHHLVHSFTESPQADLLYSGVAYLVNGKASVNIDTFHGMTEGTFEVLCRNVRTFSSNETGWHHVRCSVEGNILSLESEDDNSTDSISWLVIGERKDQHMFDTGWTNENGEVIVEPLKPEPVPEPEPVQRTVRVAITEEYNRLIPAVLDDAGEVVEKKRTEIAIRQITKIETVDVPESIQIIDGVATLIPATTEEKPVPQFESLAVFDAEGNPVY